MVKRGRKSKVKSVNWGISGTKEFLLQKEKSVLAMLCNLDRVKAQKMLEECESEEGRPKVLKEIEIVKEKSILAKLCKSDRAQVQKMLEECKSEEDNGKVLEKIEELKGKLSLVNLPKSDRAKVQMVLEECKCEEGRAKVLKEIEELSVVAKLSKSNRAKAHKMLEECECEEDRAKVLKEIEELREISLLVKLEKLDRVKVQKMLEECKCKEDRAKKLKEIEECIQKIEEEEKMKLREESSRMMKLHREIIMNRVHEMIKAKEMQEAEMRLLSLGYIFSPEDGLLVDYWLRNKCLNESTGFFIKEADVYNKHPQYLKENYPVAGNVWYFFTRGRPNETQTSTDAPGHWIFGNEMDVLFEGKKVGVKQVLEYYEGDRRTEHKIMEYKLDPPPDNLKDGPWFICKLYNDGSCIDVRSSP